MKIAYLVNQYPKVSHSFIRREISAVERCGIEVQRFSIRSCGSELVDEKDKQELEKTEIVLEHGIIGLVLSLLLMGLTKPVRWLKAIQLAAKIGWRSNAGIVRHGAYLAEACLLVRRFSALDIAHVHAHFGTNSATVAMLCHELGGPPYSMTVHGPEEFDDINGLAIREKIKHAAFVVAVSSFGKSQLNRWSEYDEWDKIHVVHCGVDESFLEAAQVPVPDVPQLVCVGRLCEQKGHLILLEAARTLAEQGLKFKLILVGDGPLRSHVEAKIEEYGLERFVEITGWASSADVRQFILDSRALVLPSFAEGLPVVIMEALAAGRPVISTYVAGIPELVKDGECGWLVPAGSMEGLAAAMRSALLSAPDELERMGRFGVEQVKQRHDAGVEAQALVELMVAQAKGPLRSWARVADERQWTSVNAQSGMK